MSPCWSYSVPTTSHKNQLGIWACLLEISKCFTVLFQYTTICLAYDNPKAFNMTLLYMKRTTSQLQNWQAYEDSMRFIYCQLFTTPRELHGTQNESGARSLMQSSSRTSLPQKGHVEVKLCFQLKRQMILISHFSWQHLSSCNKR